MLPLKDNIPTGKFPIVTVILIVLNIGVFIWQQTTPNDEYSSAQAQQLRVGERDQQTLDYGAIPYRLMHPGDGCAVGFVSQTVVKVACEGSADYEATQESKAAGAPFLPLDAVLWVLTIFFAMFMHAGFFHIAGNMLFLWVFGNNVEGYLGPLKFLLFYLLAGVIAVYAQSVLAPDSTVPTIGASGAVAGVLGAYVLLHPKAKVLTLIFIIFFVTVIEIPAMILLAIWFALQFIPAVSGLDELGSGGVAYLAHVGGFVFGMIAIKLWMMRREQELPPPSYSPTGFG